MVRGWCWYPETVQVKQAVNEGDYRCCCNGCKAKTGFTIWIFLDALSLLYSFMQLVSTTTDRTTLVVASLQSPVATIMVIFAIMSILTLKPVYMQVYGIFYLIEVVLLAIAFVVAIIGLSVVGFEISQSHGITTQQQNTKTTILTVIAEYIASLLIGAALVIWKCWVTYNFYRYIRDRQLLIDQQMRQSVPVEMVQTKEPVEKLC
ncbi:unnamed protein product, partial [Mesorhabditis belari]|uniref:Uncharacterized protein n=1 Tax=Mesorhabditis belari TaxID=2138241 RepID=A0A915GW83_9BILA